MNIKNYKDYIIENNIDGITLEEKELLDKYGIKKYEFNLDTNLIDVYQDVILNDIYKNYDIYKVPKKLPNIRFGTIFGAFKCQSNNLTSLKNCPVIVKGDFNCYQNELTTLEYCPKEVYGAFVCSYNYLLTSLIGSPKYLLKHNRDFVILNTRLSSLDYCPKIIDGCLYCNTKLKSIEDYPVCIIKNNIRNGLGSDDKLFKKLKFYDILEMIQDTEEIFEPLLDDKIKFHQMIMRLEPSFIKYYKNIPPPSKNSKLLL